MTRFWKTANLLALIVLFLGASMSAYAQDTQNSEETKAPKGFSLYEKLTGNSDPRSVTVDTSVGYRFKYFGIDAGMPFMFTQAIADPNATTPSPTYPGYNNSTGNAYVDLSFSPSLPVIDFSSVITGYAPSGSRDKGVSTGRVTFDWGNHFGFSVWRFAPFASAGVSNTVANVHMSPLIRNKRVIQAFQRPYTTLGLLGNFEAGTELKVFKATSIGTSLYDVLPHGQQKVFSQVIRRPKSATSAATTAATRAAAAKAAAKGRTPVAQLQAVAIGTADLTRDNGFSFFESTSVRGLFDMDVSYTRSVPYRLNIVTVGLGFDILKIAKRGRQ